VLPSRRARCDPGDHSLNEHRMLVAWPSKGWHRKSSGARERKSDGVERAPIRLVSKTVDPIPVAHRGEVVVVVVGMRLNEQRDYTGAFVRELAKMTLFR